MPKEYLRTTNK